MVSLLHHTAAGRLVLSLIAICFCSIAKGQLTADFTSDLTKGCAPLVVQFRDLSAGNPTSWRWDLGNGSNNVTQQNPRTSYSTPGTYTVKLIVRNANGIDSVIKSGFITVGNKPVLNFSENDNEGCAPFSVQFTDGSADVTKWDWDFGDGNSSTLQSPSHTYRVDGSFTVTLRGENSEGCSQVLTRSSLIKVNPVPQTSYTSGSASNCAPPVDVNFTNTTKANSALTYQWSFGDGTVSTLKDPAHRYITSGTYTVKLVATTSAGCVDSVSNRIAIGSVKADFTNGDKICQSTAVTFSNTSSPATVSSLWNFGDGTTSTGLNPVKVFDRAGTFVVKLVNNFGACKDSVSKTVVVLPKPSAEFTYSAPPDGCSLPVSASFNANVSGLSYLWSFGDGSTSAEQNPSHIYTKSGSYSVTLKVTNDNGCSETVEKKNIVLITPLKIGGFSNLPFSGCVPMENVFSASITSPEQVSSWQWTFGDGTSSSLQNPVHSYSVPGTFDVSLAVTTASGCKDTFLLKSAVAVSKKPTANFTATDLSFCAKDSVQFIDMSEGTVNNWKWIFGNSGIANTQNPLFSFSDTGTFNITLIAGNDKCFDTLIIPDYVYIRPPVARFDVSINCATPLVRKFNNRSISAETSMWNFGDGATSTLSQPTHTYTKTGKYIVSLSVTNGGCSDIFSDTILVIDERPNFSIGSDASCKNSISLFTATNIDTANIASYTWSFGDNSPGVRRNISIVSYAYPNAGIYSPTLTTTDKTGCQKTVQHSAAITVYGPKAGFVSPVQGCINAPVRLTDQSQQYENYSITSWVINYGDGTIDSLTAPNFSHTYTTAGRYNVALTITDSYGCRDSLVVRNAINITEPVASFTLSDSAACNNSVIRFTNTSQGQKLSYAWTFGDGGTSTDMSPTHNYTIAGRHTVSLAVSDEFGCVDTATKMQAVAIGSPSAQFTLTDSVLSCPPAQITFTNNSQYVKSLSWDFDDGSFSQIHNPVHYFSTARTYFIKLIVNGYGNCADSSVKRLVVKGPSGIISYNPVIRCAPATVSFNAALVDNTNFVWDFNDGSAGSNNGTTLTHTYVNPGKYLPKLFLYDTVIKCVVEIAGRDTVFVTDLKSQIKKHRAAICDGTGIQFGDSSLIQFDTVTTYLWNFGDGNTSNLQNPFHQFVTPGNYPVKLTVTTGGGCIESTDTSFVRVVKTPDLRIAGVSEICSNLPVNFTGTLQQPDTSAIKWSWNFNNGNTSNVATPPAQTFAAARDYKILAVVTNSTGCTDSASTTLTVHPLPAVNAGPDSTICLGQSLMLQPSGAPNYVWQSPSSLSCTNCANPVASPIDTLSRFVVTGTSSQGCKNNDTLYVRVVQPFNISTIANDTICLGDSINLPVTGTDNYTWSPAIGLNNANGPNPVATPDTTTTYTVIGQDRYGCFADTTSVRLAVYPIPAFNIIPSNVNVTAGNSITLSTTSSRDVTSWSWTPATGLNCTDCPQPVATIATDIVYTGTARNDGGCIARDKVTLNGICSVGNVFIPNTFSPNNDGMNDVFFPRGKGIAEIKSFQVFNKWGNLVHQRQRFAANREEFGWNGTHNGQPLNPDVYVYKAEVICSNGELFLVSGNVTLVR